MMMHTPQSHTPTHTHPRRHQAGASASAPCPAPLAPPARVAPFRAHYTCAELGVCQDRTPACGSCPKTVPLMELADFDADAPLLTPIERVGYWVATTALTLASIAVLCGLAGWAYARYFAL